MTDQATNSQNVRYSRSTLLIPREEALAKLQNQVQEGMALYETPINSPEALAYVKEHKIIWSAVNEELLKQIVDNDELYNSYHKNQVSATWSGKTSQEFIDEVRDDIRDCTTRLRAVMARLPFVPEPSVITNGSQQIGSQALVHSNRVFIVHGHDEEAKQEVYELLTALELEPIILHKQPNQGQTIIEK